MLRKVLISLLIFEEELELKKASIMEDVEENVDKDEGDFDVYERVEKLVEDGENVNEDEGDFDSFLEIMLLDQKGCLIEALKRNFNVLKRGML